MRLTAILDEAWRNTRTGASHFTLLALGALVIVGGLATAETLTVNALVHRARDYVDAGGDITVIATPPGLDDGHSLDGASCEALASLPGVTAAGALRTSDQKLTLAALPHNPYGVYEASPALRDVLDVTGTPATPGVWLPDAVAAATRSAADTTLPLSDGTTLRVSGIFDYPNDGRPVQLLNAIVTPVTAQNAFDECWIRSWPTAPGLIELANSLLAADADPDVIVTTGRLNGTLAATFDGASQFAARPTAPAAPVAFVAGAVLGAVAIRTRRRPLAHHRHLGVPVTAQALQTLVETLAWAVAASIIAVAGTGALATANAFLQTWSLALRVIVLGATGCIAGALLALTTIREASLFRYVKE